MKKMILLSILIVILLFGGYCTYKYFFDFSIGALPQGDLVEKVDSPDGKYTILEYEITGNATVSNCIRCELLNNETRDLRNIYWNKGEYDRNSIIWLDSENVTIYKHKLNILNDSFDFRN